MLTKIGVSMHLELHDNEAGNTLFGRVPNIDYDYQAEQWVQDTQAEKAVIRWELHDSQGLRCVWERQGDSAEMPNITKRSPRFTGEWQKGPNELVIA
jgi:hypothetical protein